MSAPAEVPAVQAEEAAAAAAPAAAAKRPAEEAPAAAGSAKRPKPAKKEEEVAAALPEPDNGDVEALAAGTSGCSFLLTCPQRREKAALRAAMELLKPHLPADCVVSALKLLTAGSVLLRCTPPLAGRAAVAAAAAVLDTTVAVQEDCARMLPVCYSLAVTTEALREAAQKLTAAQLAAEPLAEGAAFVFAVSHHARGCEKDLVGELLGRGESIKAVASGVEAACAAAGVASKVSLSAPAWALCMEVVPVACGANGKKVSPVALITLLPQRLLVTKPRLGIRSLREAA